MGADPNVGPNAPGSELLERLEGFLRKHPRELLVLSFRPTVRPEVGGEFILACEFGEEAPQPTFEARAEAVREWSTCLGTPEEVGIPSDNEVRDLLARLDDVNTGVFAGGAIYGAEPTLADTIDKALKEARS